MHVDRYGELQEIFNGRKVSANKEKHIGARHTKCRANALFARRISPEIKDAAFCTGVRTYNDTETWKSMFKVYVTTQSASEKDSAQYALTCVEDTALLYKYAGGNGRRPDRAESIGFRF